MKVGIIQPPYSMDYSQIECCFHKALSLLDECDDSLDIILY